MAQPTVEQTNESKSVGDKNLHGVQEGGSENGVSQMKGHN